MNKDELKIRNVAVIAHVDHGKTTMVDGLLKQSHTFRDNQAEMSQSLIMDSGDQERERGITITAKITAISHAEYRINIIDTPGHADFGGEVERTLNMADGCLLIVDAKEGPMPQTKFVLAKALSLGLRPIVVINKIDKDSSMVTEVEDKLADLFLELAIDESQLQYPVYYAVGREGKAWSSMPEQTSEDTNLGVIFDAIIDYIPAPSVDPKGSFQMLINALDWDSYRGKYVVGKVSRGSIKSGDTVVLCKKDGSTSKSRVDKIYASHGTTKSEVAEGVAGDIVHITGVSDAKIGETITSEEDPTPLPVPEIEKPTLSIYLGPNTSPFKGTESEFNTSRQIKERLDKELETNIGLEVEESGIGFVVSGRGELHLSVLIETMRREGYEFEVGRPQVITREENGVILEPIEEVIVEVPEEFVGVIQTEFGSRQAEFKSQIALSSGEVSLAYTMPVRAFLGLRNLLMTKTRGTVVINSSQMGYGEMGQALKSLRNGVLIAFETGVTTPYALQNAESRGVCFVGPGEKVYAGQIVGLNSRQDDLEINVCKAKHLTNMRSKSSDGTVQLTPPQIMSLEQCIDFIEKDELLEVTPKNLRLRKKELDQNKRKRASKSN